MWHLARVCSFGCVLAVLAALVTPTEVVAQKKKKGADNGYGALPEDYKSIVNKKELVGEIVAVSGLVVTLRVDTPKVEANPKYKPPKGVTTTNNPQYRLWDNAQRLQRDLQQAQNAKTPQERQRAMQRYQQELIRYQQEANQINQQLLNQAAKGQKTDNKNNTTDPFIVVHSYKEFDLETQEKLVVRKMFLPMEYDDMGNVKTYTQKQKDDLKDARGGYVSKLEEAAPGMEAKLLLTAPKKSKEAKADEEVERPTINTIVLTKDSPSAGNIPAADPKKKKK